jgi:FkbM family methyltransferase
VSNLFSALKKSPLGKYYLNSRISTIRFGIAKGLKRKGGLGILGLFIREDSKEDAYIRNLQLTNKVVYDIGANFGAFTLYFLKHAEKNGFVVAFEPIKTNCEDIRKNVEINSLDITRLTIINKGVGKDHRTMVISFDPTNTARASFDASISNQIKAGSGSTQENIEIDALDNISEHSLPNPDFVKIDVEGFELEVLQGMTNTLKTKPHLLIENHGADNIQKKNNIADIVSFLEPLGYKMMHVESETPITPQNSFIASSGHICCK